MIRTKDDIIAEMNRLYEYIEANREDMIDPDGNNYYCPDWCSGDGDCIVCILEEQTEEFMHEISLLKQELKALD
jgi:hypothetical protein